MPPSLVLFVCVENSCRSQMAEGFARRLAGERFRVFSAGSRPSGEVDPRTVRMMAEKGVDLTGQRSTGLDELPDGARWEYVVTMGCGDACPHLPAVHRLDWDLPDPKPMDDGGFGRVRDEIERRVLSLLAAGLPSDDVAV
jgi:protein-tyrosine-phosphatase